MLRRTVFRIGLLPGLVLGAGAMGLVGDGGSASASAAPAEFHAPRVPGPTVYTRIHHKVYEQWSSTNWSGYAITGSYTSVTGHWNVPQVQTPATKALRKKATYSSSWVGIDGFEPKDTNLIQAGTEQDWTGGKHGAAFYQAWWEILPASETPITTMTVHPGDAMVVTITKGDPNWTITVTDTTTGKSFSTEQSYSGPGQSAEWIQEAPTLGNRVATLTDDGTVTFDPQTANAANPGFVPADAGVMFQKRKQVSTPSAPNAAGDGFAVAYGPTAPSAPSF